MRHEPLARGSTIGILGGGQLGRLLAIAASKLGFKAAIYTAEDDAPAVQVVEKSWRASYGDEARLREFAAACDAVTFEFENVPVDALRFVEKTARVSPPPLAAEVAQDRLNERRFFASLGAPVASYVFIEDGHASNEAVQFVAENNGAILKRTREGYDGRGQLRISAVEDLEPALRALNGPCILEAVMPFVAETSIICVRDAGGDIQFYDSPVNRHENGILKTSSVPSPHASLAAEGKAIVSNVAHTLNYVGVLAIEFFVLRDERGLYRLVVNEMAPRVHNSGHWTLDACYVSQFENHIRAVAGWPIGSTARHSNATMTNLLGPDIENWKARQKSSDTGCVYIYGKSEARPGRKVGHITELSPLTTP